MRQNVSNLFLFVLLGTGLTFAFWFNDKQQKAKRPKTENPPAEVKKDDPAAKPPEEAVAALVGGPAFAAASQPAPESPEAKSTPPAPPPPPSEPPTFISLGGPNYYNRMLLSTRGAGIQWVGLPLWVESDRLGRPMAGKDGPVRLNLIPGVTRTRTPSLKDTPPPPDLHPGKQAVRDDLAEPSYTLFHYANPDDKNPDPLLGERNWDIVSEEHPEGGEHKVVFQTELGDPFFLTIRKTFSLGPKDFHAKLKLEFIPKEGRQKDKGKFRYQIAGPRGLPIEGEWYSSTYRVALTGWTDHKGQPKRQYDDSTTVGVKRGGDAVLRADNNFKYTGVVTQYFASVLVIDENAAVKNPWAYTRATTELPFDKLQNPSLPYFDDVTVRAVSDPLDPAAGETVTHDYLIYNGPVKVRLLKMVKDETGQFVDPALVDRYHDALGMYTLTDYHSPTYIGVFASKIYFADLVITFTNLMHGFLYMIHRVVPNWAVGIIVLTICVRLMLFFPSKKQTQMNLRMMEIQKRLKPEIDKLQEKYKGDSNTFNREKTKLLMSNGMNPFTMMGGCLLLFAQMPIMMGLYFCLQESIFFRLEPFLWMKNLAAPDMLVWWGEKIPVISTPADIGSLPYLGPFFNIMPVLAVSLMLYQQTKMMPPPTDDQMAQQQRVMKFMMIMVAVMFYKIAAGLCLYFTVSTLWGIIERQLIPKANDKPADGDGTASKLPPASGSPNGVAHVAKPKGLLGRFKEKLKERLEEVRKRAEEQAARQIRNDKGGQPPGGGPPGTRRPPPDRRDKKKRRRK